MPDGRTAAQTELLRVKPAPAAPPGLRNPTAPSQNTLWVGAAVARSKSAPSDRPWVSWVPEVLERESAAEEPAAEPTPRAGSDT